MNSTRLFCDNWEFSKNPIDTAYSDDLNWQRVDIPHDWMIYQVKDLYETSTGWYRKSFTVNDTDRRTALRFDGVYMDSKVYINGKQVFEWKYGYSTFEFDITDHLVKGENTVWVRVDYRCPNTRWYSGAGIFRNVYIKQYEAAHILSDGVYISADGSGDTIVSVECARPENEGVSSYTVGVCLKDSEGNIVGESIRPMCAAFADSIPDAVRESCNYPVSYSLNSFEIKVDAPAKWDIAAPVLYTAEAVLYRDGEAIHRETVTYGYKDFSFEPEKGFIINGRTVKLHGVCEHHDNGALGAAFNRAAMRRKFTKLREMGVNALRTTHNMPDPQVMELADEMGFVVVAEGFDMWEMHKTEYDYAAFFKDWLDKDVASWVRRDRNHVCLIAWSLGNEIYDTHAGDHGQEIASRLIYLVRKHDPRKNGYVTIGSNYMQWDNARKCADMVKLAGYNYTERLYDEHHSKYPDWTIYGSETASTLQSRGIYYFPLSQPVLADDDKQCSALGNCSTGWGAVNSEYCITMDRDRDYVAGQFIWTGFDYIGEPTPYDTKNSYFGQFDTAGFPKDSAFLYRAVWTDHKTAPFVHIFPYWDHTEGQLIDVRVASNAPFIRLFRDGELIAERPFDRKKDKHITLDVCIPYHKGELKAVAYDEDMNVIAEDIAASFGDTARFALDPDKTELRADGSDLIYLTITALDNDGRYVANANDRVLVEVSGAGRLVGLDNGDSNDFEEYKGTSRRLFSGKLLAIIAAKDITGDIDITVSSPHKAAQKLTLKAVEGIVPEGASYFTENTHTKADTVDEENDIPIRKIEFESESFSFSNECREMVFRTVVYPAASNVSDITYRITNPVGIDSNLAEIVSIDGDKVTVRCKGDGNFCLRAVTNNGLPQCRLISSVRLSAEGIGAASFDPYSFVSGGLFGIGSDNACNGIEKGAQFAGGDCWFGFENVDFGIPGSDTVTLPIYSNNNNPVYLKIYDGTPDNGELIADIKYDKKPIWITYQPITVKLDKVLKGMHTLSFRSSEGYSIKGFEFEKTEKEFAEIQALDRDTIYGDKFTVSDDAVTGIGNNVVLEFGEFDFSEKKPRAVVICGRSSLPLNSIHVSFKDDSTEKILCEFERAEEYTEREFPVSVSGGKVNVSFTFLPGSEFDFRSFRFVE